VIIEFFNTPTTSNAGNNQWYLPGTITTLEGNTPQNGTGQWFIAEGTGGNVLSPNNPNSIFTGIYETFYILLWTINTQCKSSIDTVVIHFGEQLICGITPLIDERDGQYYSTVLIGSQCWMAENLNIGQMIVGTMDQIDNDTIEKYCYNNDTINCNIYGGLYQWDEMMQYVTTEGAQGICPSGGHLPTDEEWKQLEGEVDSQYGYPDAEWDGTDYRGFDAGLNLKSASDWYSGGNGTDLYGFTALPGGYRSNIGSFNNLGSRGYFWSSTEYSTGTAWSRKLHCYYDEVYRGLSSKGHGRSVRCLQD